MERRETNRFRNCFDSIMNYLSEKIGFDYELFYLEHWSFKYKNNNGTIGSKLSPGWKGTPSKSIANYHGLEFKWHFIGAIDDVVEMFLDEKQKGNDLIAYIDSYDLIWSPGYSNYHVDHAILLESYDYDEEGFWCEDPFSINEKMLFKCSHVSKLKKICVVNYVKRKESFDYCNVMLKSLKRNKSMNHGNGIYYSMIAFVDDLSSNFDINKEIEGYCDVMSSPLFRNLIAISAGRYFFADALAYISIASNRWSCLGEYVQKFHELALMWEGIRNSFLRMALYKKNIGIENLCNKISEIARIENHYLDELIELLTEER